MSSGFMADCAALAAFSAALQKPYELLKCFCSD
jgi:hypothetical protein